MATCPCCGGGVDNSDILLDMNTNTLSCGGQTVKMPGREAEILFLLIEHMPRKVTVDDFEYRIWPASQDVVYPRRVLDVHITKLRKRLDGTGLRIDTIWGDGWRLVKGPAAINKSAQPLSIDSDSHAVA